MTRHRATLFSAFAKELVTLSPDDENAWTRLDAAYEGKEDDFDLISFAKEITRQQPSNPFALARLSLAYKNQGKYTRS